MCLSPKPPKSNAAAEAEQKEKERQERIRQGQASIDNAFSQFNDDYYNKRSSDYTDYYNPQVDQQFKEAMDKLTLQLGQQGILQSSEGNRQLSRLRENYGQQKQTIADNAIKAANDARQQVANQKTTLYNQNNTAADPSLAASQASQAAASVVNPPTFSPLGALFAGLIGQGTNALAVQQGGGISTGGGNFLPVGNATAGISGASQGSSGSGRIVN